MNHHDPHIKAFLKAIVRAGRNGDRVHMTILADYLEEQGDPLAAGWRWLAKKKYWPWHQPGVEKEFCWYKKSLFNRWNWKGDLDNIPDKIWNKISFKQSRAFCDGVNGSYKTATEALRMLVQAAVESGVAR